MMKSGRHKSYNKSDHRSKEILFSILIESISKGPDDIILHYKFKN